MSEANVVERRVRAPVTTETDMNIIQAARDAGLWCPSGEPESGNWYGCIEELQAFAALVAAAERERLAKAFDRQDVTFYGSAIAESLRRANG